MPNRRITDLIVDAASRTPAQSVALADALARKPWPGGGDDRIDPVAREWLRRWTPKRMTAAADCACAAGRCAWCN